MLIVCVSVVAKRLSPQSYFVVENASSFRPIATGVSELQKPSNRGQLNHHLNVAALYYDCGYGYAPVSLFEKEVILDQPEERKNECHSR